MTEDQNARARAEGRLEGRLEGLEQRMDRHETWIAGEMKTLGGKLDQNGVQIGELLRMVIGLTATQSSNHRWTNWIWLLAGSAMSGLALRLIAH